MDDIDQTYFAPDGLIYMIAESRSKAESPFMPNIQTLFRKSTILSEKLKELLRVASNEFAKKCIHDDIFLWLALPEMVAVTLNKIN